MVPLGPSPPPSPPGTAISALVSQCCEPPFIVWAQRLFARQVGVDHRSICLARRTSQSLPASSRKTRPFGHRRLDSRSGLYVVSSLWAIKRWAINAPRVSTILRSTPRAFARRVVKDRGNDQTVPEKHRHYMKSFV